MSLFTTDAFIVAWCRAFGSRVGSSFISFDVLARIMDHVGRIFRPPGEANSLLLQVTVGCSHNGCTFCGMYRQKRFRPKPAAQIEADLQNAAQLDLKHRRVFLCDGDALILSTRRLLHILDMIRHYLPRARRVGAYGDTRCVRSKSTRDLEELRDGGLSIVYHGIETGDDEVMRRIDKGATRAECVEMAHKLREADMQHVVMIMLGIGGKPHSASHAHQTATLLTEMDPLFIAAMTTLVVPGTPLHTQQARGDFTLPSKLELIEELRIVVAQSHLGWCQFSSTHPSNYLSVQGTLPTEKGRLLADIDAVLAARDEKLLRPEHLRSS